MIYVFEDNGNNTYFRWYYKKDCKCVNHLELCTDKSVQNKSADFLKAYPCIPSGSRIHGLKPLTLQDIWDVHRRLVEEHNKLCEELREKEPNTEWKNKYKEIKNIC